MLRGVCGGVNGEWGQESVRILQLNQSWFTSFGRKREGEKKIYEMNLSLSLLSQPSLEKI